MARKTSSPVEQIPSRDGTFIEQDLLDTVTTLSWSPNGQSLLACTRSGKLLLMDENGDLQWHAQAHQRAIIKASWSCNSDFIATSGTDSLCKIWDARIGRCLFEPKSESGWTEHLSWSPFLPILMTTSGKKLRLWTDSGKLVEDLQSHDWPITDLGWHPAQREVFATCAADGISIWRLARSKPTHVLNCPEYPERLVFNRNGTTIAYGASDKSINVWSVDSGQLIKAKISLHGQVALDWSWGGQWLAFCDEYEAYLWRINESSPRAHFPQRLHGSFGRLTHLKFHAYEHLIASADDEGSVHVWRTDREERLMPVSMCHYDHPVSAISWNPLSRTLAIAYNNGGLRVWSNQFMPVRK